MRKILNFIGLIAIIVMLAAVVIGHLACNSAPPQIKLINLSDNTLNNVTVSGEGFVKVFSAVAPRTTEEFSVRPNGESGCEIKFTINGRLYQKGDLAYLEASGGYFLDITIQTNLEIKVDAGLRP